MRVIVGVDVYRIVARDLRLVQTQTFRYRLAPYCSLSVDLAHGETPPPLGCNPQVVKTHADGIYTGLRFNEVIKYGEGQRRKEAEERNAKLITFP